MRDDRFDPTEGYFVRLITDAAGLAGDVNFVRGRIGAGTYYPFTEDWVASLTAEVGAIEGLDDRVRIQHRFLVGGENLRGFAVGGIGPRDINTTDALGGNRFFTGSAELRFPTGLPREVGLRGFVFSDFGTLTEVDATGPDIRDVDSIRVSLGVGMQWRSPFGPIRVSLARPIRKEGFDETELFRFSFGSRF
jgi:outer membrane protein insertion porin family